MKLNVLVLTIALLYAQIVSAQLIIDTGSGPSTGGLILEQTQWLATEFTLDQTYTISDIEGWGGAGPGGAADILIYADSATGPGLELYSGTVNVIGSDNHWFGLHNLTWLLDAGTYWAAFEVHTGQSMRGWMGDGVPFPSGAFSANQYGQGWTVTAPNTIGLRITAEEYLPEPQTFSLIGVGLVALIISLMAGRPKFY